LPISDDNKLTLINRLKAELKDCSATDACGVCARPRRNFLVSPSQLSVSSRGIDQGEDFFAEDWSMEALRDRVDLICAFDAASDAIRSNFVALLEDYDVVEVTEHRPVQVKTLVARVA